MSKRRLLPAVAVVFINLWGATVILPILPLIAVDMLGGTVLQAVLLDTSYYGAKLLAAPVLGRWSDRYGRRPLLLLSQIGTTFSFLLFLTAIPLGEMLNGSAWILPIHPALLLFYLARLLDGFTGGNSSIAQAYVTDITPPERHTQALGTLAAALGVGFITGPAIGGVLAARGGINAPFIAGALLSATGVVLTYFLLAESLPPERRGVSKPKNGRRSLWQAWGDPALRRNGFPLLLLIGFFITLCFAAISPTFSLYARQVLFAPPATTTSAGQYVGFVFMLMGVVMVLTQGVLIKPLVERLGERGLIFGSGAMLLAAFAIVPLAATPWGTAMALVPLAFAYSLSDPSLQSCVTHSSESTEHGKQLGVYASVLSLAYLVGPLWAGFLFQRISPAAIWWGGAVLLLPATIFAWRFLLLGRSNYSVN